jgi:diacylglycerol kinase family enzyme
VAPAILVANAAARSGRVAARIARARDLLRAAGIEHELVPTEPAGGTIGAVRRAIAGGTRRVIAMGGDGTFAEVAKGILASDHAGEVAMGMLPMGTANDQGKSFGMAAGEGALEANIAVFAAGHVFELDVGRVQLLDAGDQVAGSELFFDSFSVGLGAAVLAGRNRDRQRAEGIPLLRSLYRDQLVYAGALVKRLAASLGRGATFSLEADIDGVPHRWDDVLDVIVKNTPVYGGEWILAPDGLADDGLLELVPICGLGDFGSRMVSTLRGSPIGEYDLRRLGVELARPVPGQRFDLTIMQPGAAAPPPAQIDGEELPPGDRFRVDVLPRILRLVVPAPERGGAAV